MRNLAPQNTAVTILPFGTVSVPLIVPLGIQVANLESCIEIDNTTPSPRDIVRQSLDQPVGSPRLREIASGRGTATILIPGKTRVAGTQDYLPVILDELNDAGIPDEKIEIFLATGTHEPHIENDVSGLLGPQVSARVRCIAHDCQDIDGLECVGTTSAGTPVLFSRRVLQSEVKVLTGRVVPHYFAGYSGGRKALLPGVAGFETIRANHRLTLHPERGLHPDAAPCSLTHNPIHLDMVEAVAMASPDFTLNTLMSKDRRMAYAIAGDPLLAHAAICAQADELLQFTLPEAVDAVITSPGGQPSDCNFMQSIKALFNLKEIVRPGGAMLWVAECPHGIHPGFLEFGAIESDDALEDAVRTRYALTGHNSMMLRALLRKVDVALVSTLPTETVTRLGIHPFTSIEDGIRWLQNRFSGTFTYAVAPEANTICASLEATHEHKPGETSVG